MDSPLRPLATLESDKPEHVHAYITKLLDANLNSDTSARITSDQDTWVTVLSGITRFMFVSPPEGKAAWSTLGEKIDMIENSLEVIQRASARVDGLFFKAGHLAHQILTRLLDLSCVFEVWDSHEGNGGDACSPKFMRDKTVEVILVVVRSLGDSVSTPAMDRPMWEILRLFLVEVLDVITGMHLLCRIFDILNMQLRSYISTKPSNSGRRYILQEYIRPGGGMFEEEH